MTNDKKKVLAILFMRFQVQPAKGIAIAQEWLNQHPQSSWETLETLLKQDRLVLVEGILKDVAQSSNSNNPKQVRKYRGAEIAIEQDERQQNEQSSGKELRYRGAKYS